MTKLISVTDTAKLIRPVLTKAFPGVKFSVKSKSYSGGASINISWTDGPTEDMVNNVVKGFEGASFDSMQDLKSYQTTKYNGETVNFGSDYVFCDRHHSRAALEKAITTACTKYGFLPPCITERTWNGHTSYELTGAQADYRPDNIYDTVSSIIYREMRQMNLYESAQA